MTKLPLLSVPRVWVILVAMLRAMTVALGITASWGSAMRPTNRPDSTWAKAERATGKEERANRAVALVRRYFRMFIVWLPSVRQISDSIKQRKGSTKGK